MECPTCGYDRDAEEDERDEEEYQRENAPEPSMVGRYLFMSTRHYVGSERVDFLGIYEDGQTARESEVSIGWTKSGDGYVSEVCYFKVEMVRIQ